MDQTITIKAGTGTTPELTEERTSWVSMLWTAIARFGRLAPDTGMASRKGSSHDVNQDYGLRSCSAVPTIAVADGVSRSNRGEMASQLALVPFAMSRITGCSNLRELAFVAHNLVKRCYGLINEKRIGQCTLVAARVKRLAIAEYINVGDSRAYLLTPNGFVQRNYSCRQLTIDQTHGERKKRVAYEQPEKFRDDMMVHAIGYRLIPEEIEIGSISIPPGGMLLLATDGFFKGMGDDHCHQIARLAEKHCSKGMQELANALVAEAAQNFDIGDDITVALASPAYLAGARWPFWAVAAAFFTLCITILL